MALEQAYCVAQFDNRIDNLGHPMSHYAYGMGWGSACAGPLDLFKMTVGEGGIRSPLLIGGEMQNGQWMWQGAFKAEFVPPPYGSDKWQLFNVVGDPGETRDLSKEQPELLKKLQEAWDEYADEVGVIPFE